MVALEQQPMELMFQLLALERVLLTRPSILLVVDLLPRVAAIFI